MVCWHNLAWYAGHFLVIPVMVFVCKPVSLRERGGREGVREGRIEGGSEGGREGGGREGGREVRKDRGREGEGGREGEERRGGEGRGVCKRYSVFSWDIEQWYPVHSHHEVTWPEIPSINFLSAETIFGVAPFASKSFVELENKIRSTEPVEVSSRQRLLLCNGFTVCQYVYMCVLACMCSGVCTMGQGIPRERYDTEC